jgi:hypothetical protein
LCKIIIQTTTLSTLLGSATFLMIKEPLALAGAACK